MTRIERIIADVTFQLYHRDTQRFRRVSQKSYLRTQGAPKLFLRVSLSLLSETLWYNNNNNRTSTPDSYRDSVTVTVTVTATVTIIFP